MSAQDTLTLQVPMLQDALGHALQESGAAGTGPVNQPPPADIQSAQARSQSTADPFSYSNTLHVQLYRDADGKVWTQPGPGHDVPNLEMRIRKANGQWQIVTEVTHVSRVVKRKGHVYTTVESDALTTSGAPADYALPSDQGHGFGETDARGEAVVPTEVRNKERFEHFTPADPKTAMRQALTRLQQKGVIYVYDPDATSRSGTGGLRSKGLLAVAAAAAILALAAFAGLGPFGSPVRAAAAPAAPSTAPAPVAAAPVKLVGGGTISFALPPRYGTGLSITDYYCQNTTLSNGATEEPAMGIHGLLAGHTYSAFFSATRTNVIFENVSATPAMFGGAAATYVQGQRVAGTIAVQTGPDTAGTSRQGAGTVTVDLVCSGGPAPVGAAPAASAAPLGTTVAPATSSGPSLWGPTLAVVAVAAAAAAFATRARGTATAVSVVSPERKSAPDCAKLTAAVTELEHRVGRYQARADEAWVLAQAASRGPLIAGGMVSTPEELESVRLNIALGHLKDKLFDVRMALDRCQAGAGPDTVPVDLHEGYEPTWSDGGFNPLPPGPQRPQDDDDSEDRSKRQEIG